MAEPPSYRSPVPRRLPAVGRGGPAWWSRFAEFDQGYSLRQLAEYLAEITEVLDPDARAARHRIHDACIALTYIMGGVGLPVMRKYAPTLHRPFRLPWMWLWAPVGFLAAWMIVYWSAYSGLTQIYAAVFVGLPLFVWYYARIKGWFASAAQQHAAIAMSLVYLGAWFYIQIMGGWAARVAPPVGGSWGFIVYWIAQCADVLFFCGALWLLCNAEGRRHVARGMWLVFTLLAVYLPSYYGGFGPEKSPPLPFPWGTLIAVGIGLVAFGWGVLSGFHTEEFQEVVKAAEATQPVLTRPTPHGGTTAA